MSDWASFGKFYSFFFQAFVNTERRYKASSPGKYNSYTYRNFVSQGVRVQ